MLGQAGQAARAQANRPAYDSSMDAATTMSSTDCDPTRETSDHSRRS